MSYKEKVEKLVKDQSSYKSKVMALVASKAAQTGSAAGAREQAYTQQQQTASTYDIPAATKRLVDMQRTARGNGLDTTPEIEALRKEIQNASYAQIPANADYAEKSQYVPQIETAEPQNWFQRNFNPAGVNPAGQITNTKSTDLKYDYINRNEDAINLRANRDLAMPDTEGDLLATDPWQVYAQMTDDERGRYNYLYATRGAGDADKYLDSITQVLNERNRRADETRYAQMAREDPVAASVFSVPERAKGGLSYLSMVEQMASGKGLDVNAPSMKYTYVPNTVTDAVSEDFSGAGKFLYQTGMSMADNLYQMALTGGKASGPAGEYTMLAIMGGSAASSAVMEAKDRGLSDGQAMALGTLAGAIEFATEKIGIDNLYSPKQLSGSLISIIGKTMGSQALAEGTEEGISSVANEITDRFIAGGKAKTIVRVREIQEQEGLSYEDALRKAYGEWIVDELLLSVAGGALSGLGFGAGSLAVNAAGTSSYKSTYGGDVESLVRESLEIDPDNKLAQNILTKLENGKKNVSGLTIAQLVEGNEAALYEQDRDKIKTAAAQRLIAYGETGDVARIADAITKKAAGETLTRAEQRLIDSSTGAQRVINELDTANIKAGAYNSAWAERLDTERISPEEYGRLVREAAIEPETQETEQADIPAPSERNALTQPTETPEEGAQDGARIVAEFAPKLGVAGGETLTALYNARQEPNRYIDGMTQAYLAGLRGSDIAEVEAPELASAQIEAAYEAGRTDAAVYLTSTEQGTNAAEARTTNIREENNNGRNIRVREGSVGQNGKNTAVKVQSVEERAGRTESGASEQRKLAADIRAFVSKNRGITASSARELRIPGGTINKSAKVLNRAALKRFPKLNSLKTELEKSTGGEVTLYTGRLEVMQNGEIVREDSLVFWDKNGKAHIFIKADSYVDPLINGLHEEYHDMVHKNPALLQETKKWLVENSTKEERMQLCKRYAEDYYGVVTEDENISDDDYLLEELLADAWANRDRYSDAAATPYAEGVREAASRAASVRGPPERSSAATDGEARYSTKTENRKPYDGISLAEDSKAYTYDFMTAQPDMTVAEMPALSAVKDGNNISQEKAVELGLENAKALGRVLDNGDIVVRNGYTGREISIGKSGLEHSLDGENISRLRTNARLSAIGGEIVKNAIPVNALENAKKQVSGTYAMAALLQSGDRHVVAIVTVEQRKNSVDNIDYVDVTHAINGRLEKENSRRSSTREPDFKMSATSAAHISIADFLEIVNTTHRSILSDDVLRHFGETRPEDGYYAGRVKFSQKMPTVPDTDSEGRDLSTGQQEYFKDSKVRDENGKLLVVYHGTDAQFTTFDIEKAGSATGFNMFGDGFYFTSSKRSAKSYSSSNRVVKAYLNIENPYYAKDADAGRLSRNKLLSEGYDGVVVNGAPGETTYIAFEPEQIKRTDNLNPTKDPDIRFSRSNWTPKLTKAERSLIDYAVNAYEGEDFNGTKRYVLKSKKGETVFAVYSTETNTPTLLFANSGNSAIIAKKITESYKEELYGQDNRIDGRAFDEGAKALRNISGSNAPGSALSGNSGTANSNAGILEGQLRYGANGRSGNQQNGRNSRELRALINTLTDSRSVRFSRESFPAGEQPRARDVEVPVKVNGRNVSQTVRTVEEAAATPDDLIPTIDSLVQEGVFSYDRVSNKERIAAAEESVRREGFERTLEQWSSAVRAGGVKAENTALGWALYNAAANTGDTEKAADILRLMVGHQRDAAQAVQATRILKRLSPSAQLYAAVRSIESINDELQRKYGGKVGEVRIDEGLVADYNAAETQEERDAVLENIYRDVGKQLPSNWQDRFNAWRYLAMLGNPKTHIRNILGNAVFAPVVAVKDVVATGIETVFADKLDTRTKALIGPNDMDILQAAWTDYEKHADEALGEKYNDASINTNKSVQEGRQIFGKTKVEAWNRTGGKALETLRVYNGIALDTEDIWFSKPHYVFAMAQYCKANGVTAADIARNSPKAQEARRYAIREAQKATYRDENWFSRFMKSLGSYKGSNKALKAGSMLVGGVLPFRGTPANILARGVEYSPIGLAYQLTAGLAQVRSGTKTATDFIDGLSAGLTGTALTALGFLLAKLGLVKGRKKDRQKEAAYEDLTGHQPYALELPNGTSVTLDWLAPEALPFFVGVNLFEALGGNETAKMDDYVGALARITEPMLELSCLQGINGLIEGVSYNKSNAIAAAIGSAANSLVSQIFPTLLGQIERTAQPVRMTTYADKNKWLSPELQRNIGTISAKVPGIDYNQIPYIDAWGRTESTGSIGKRAFDNFVNPSYTSKVNESAMERELWRLYEATGESAVLPANAAKYVTVNKQEVNFTGVQYVTYATVKGSTAYAAMTKMCKSPAYSALTDKQKTSAVKKVYAYAGEIAKSRVFGTEYELDKWVETAKEVGIDLYAISRAATSDITALKNEKGNSITNSNGLLRMQELYKIEGVKVLSDEARIDLFADCEIGETVIGLSEKEVNQALKEMQD